MAEHRGKLRKGSCRRNHPQSSTQARHYGHGKTVADDAAHSGWEGRFVHADVDARQIFEMARQWNPVQLRGGDVTEVFVVSHVGGVSADPRLERVVQDARLPDAADRRAEIRCAQSRRRDSEGSRLRGGKRYADEIRRKGFALRHPEWSLNTEKSRSNHPHAHRLGRRYDFAARIVTTSTKSIGDEAGATRPARRDRRDATGATRRGRRDEAGGRLGE